MQSTTLRVASNAARAWRFRSSIGRLAEPAVRHIGSSTSRPATALPITATGPPPSAPIPTSSQYGDRVDERRRKAELLQKGKELRNTTQTGKKTSPLKKRFWSDVHVKEVPEGYQVFLDTRPVRTPTKSILTVPRSKPHLAHAIAIEWDMLENAQQALKNHNIPMTSIVARAQDTMEAEARGDMTVRDEIINFMMRYLDTDTLLCWAPGQSSETATSLEMQTARKTTLRELQIQTAMPIISYLKTSVWPGVEIRPVLDEHSIMPVKQSEVTRSVIQGWIAGLPAWELAALERAVLAGKSVLIGTRLLIDWSEEFRDLQRSSEKRFGIEEAAEAASLEVKWQTGMWGEVEDTHDVDNEDIRQQFGSAILLVSGHR
ncbi:ATP synthase mitochondrial F1 complex assembly factor 2 [Exophiala viscosa]|uniref:ATP synthase mitochondrial F1 complex assembly factor 2 n=1 Tax=Exophiala viscosa TaxID=2486360 RepID=UPI00218F687C|nr:ATP synthase mitochondrial F1 complex assembly factor 2 [Exophiala viscosa]